jgi:hypothetical protein
MSTNEKNKSARRMADKNWFIVMAAVIVCFAFGPPQAGAGITWLQKQKLTASDGATGDCFGQSVSISGDYAIIGAYCDDTYKGSAYIFKWDGTGWIQQQKLTASDGVDYDYFGYSVSISGDWAIVGAYRDDNEKGINAGSAYMFKWDGTNWILRQKLLAPDGAAGDCFGNSVSIRGGYAIIGANWDDDKGNDSGSAYIYKKWWDEMQWVLQQKLTASDGGANGFFGYSVSISGDYAIIGQPAGFGSAYLFWWNGLQWIQLQKLTASDGASDDKFGWSVSISDDYAIVGSYGDDDRGNTSGSAYIFKRDGIGWSQQAKLLATDGAASNGFGWSVSISGDYAVIGACWDDDKGAASGSAYIFRWDGAGWIQQQKLLASDGNAYDYFGCSVSVSGDKTIVGAYGGDNKGSAYIFIPTGTGTLTVLAPNGGENIVAGSTYDITWDTNGVVENVFTEYSDNNGVDWTAIDTVANTGSYPWLVPDVNSEQCLVRLSDASYPGYLPAGDVSDDAFRIYVCTLTHDYNHDCFVDFFDFSHFATEWLRCGDPCDLNCQP